MIIFSFLGVINFKSPFLGAIIYNVSTNNYSKQNNIPIVRWTIGDVRPDGYRCLVKSINSFKELYKVEIVICYNCSYENIPSELLAYNLIDQSQHIGSIQANPKGVSWKLYPPRLDINRHELFIDNDLIIKEKIPQIDHFFENNCTILLAETGRTYGRFENYVPPDKCINSGLFGLPPKFNLQNFLNFYVGAEWQTNAHNEYAQSQTWDEQGLIAFALLTHPDYVIIPETEVSNCEYNLTDGKGYHFIGLNRRAFHRPFKLWLHKNTKIFI